MKHKSPDLMQNSKKKVELIKTPNMNGVVKGKTTLKFFNKRSDRSSNVRVSQDQKKLMLSLVSKMEN